MKNISLSAFPFGMVLLAIAILMDRYLPENNLVDFIDGLLLGLSLVLNIGYVFNCSRKILCS